MQHTSSVLAITAFAAGLALAQSASAADQVYVDPVPAAAPMVYDWSGAYVGLQAGYGDLEPNSNAVNLIQPDSDGFVGGLQIGYNFQMDSFVFGVEGDIVGMDLDETVSCFNPAFNCSAGADWMASIRARAGVAFDRFLVYGTGGVAFLGYNGSTVNIGAGTVFPDSQTLTGWTVGAGAEYAWNDRVIVGLEGRYSEFETTTMQYDVPYTVSPEVFTVMGRVSFKFGN